ncbi:MAG: cytochrome c peroxidase [Gemmataceae bacterium]
MTSKFVLGCLLSSASLILTCLLAGPSESFSAEAKSALKNQLRRPVALALADGGKTLFIANHRSGTISAIDLSTNAVVEIPVGQRLADITLTPDGRYLLTVDEEANQLVVLARSESKMEVVHRLAVANAPVCIQISADGKHCFVASLWSRQLSVIELKGETNKPIVAKTIDLPFAPRKQLLIKDTNKLIVADSFGGQIGLVDIEKGTLVSVRRLPAHNIRGLAISPGGKELLLAHQVLRAEARSNADDIHWGNLITNNVRMVPLAAVLTPDGSLTKGARLLALGDVGKAAGDPAGLAVCPDGTLLVSTSGTDEVSFGKVNTEDWSRLSVGRGPTAVLVSLDGRQAFVSNTFADSVSIVSLVEGRTQAEVALGPQPDLKRADRGEILFHDAKLSHDGWLSCHSCHTDGHTNGLLNDNLSDGTFGTPKRVLTLLGVKDTAPWAWNGSVNDLKDQIRNSITLTMRGAKPTDEQVKDLEAYLQTLAPPPPVKRAGDGADQDSFKRGHEVFNQRGCAACHPPPIYTSKKGYDVGLTDQSGHATFNPPSLRGVSQGGPYFHDNSASSLEDVFVRHRHQLKTDLSKQERADLLDFLRSL